MIILAAALMAAQTAPYTYHMAAKPGSPIANLQQLCKRLDDAKSERERQRLVPQIKRQFAGYQGDRDELMLRCERRVQFR